MLELTREASSASVAAFVNALSQTIGEEQFKIWFARLRCTFQAPDVLELELPNAQFVHWVREKYGAELEQAAYSALDTQGRLEWRASDGSLEQASLASNGASSGYTQIPNRWLDELKPRIGLVRWGVFEALFRFVWRGPAKVRALQKHLEQGEQVAYVSKQKLAQVLGLSTRRVQSNVRALEQLGLVQTVRQPRGGANLHILGQTRDGETFWFADPVLKQLQNHEGETPVARGETLASPQVGRWRLPR